LSSPLYFSKNLRFKLVLNSLLLNFLDRYNYRMVKYAYQTEKNYLKIIIVAFRQVYLLPSKVNSSKKPLDKFTIFKDKKNSRY
jgi:hypothetical protein